MAQVDIFSPFRRRPEEHEDRLTWGFLIALKYAPALQAFFRDLILRHVPPERWPSGDGWDPVAVSTQTNNIGPEASVVVSVLLTDASLPESIDVKTSDRTARYDGVVEYADGLVLIIENKPRSSDVWQGQLSPSRDSFSDLSEEVDLYEQAVSIEWAEVLEGILKYTASPLSSYPERTIATDFLGFAQDCHPSLSPYRTFELCGTRQEALDKRIESLLDSMAERLSLEVGERPGGSKYLRLPTEAVKQFHLFIHQSPESDIHFLRAGLWPGDTVAQARAFLDRVDKEAFLDLPGKDWQVHTNLHFSHFRKHLVWAETALPVEDYLAFFQAYPAQIGRVNFNEVSLEALIRKWRERVLIAPSDEEDLRREFDETNRGYLNVVPGFQLSRDWPMAKVIELEKSDRLEAHLIDALREPLMTWQETLPE